MFKGLREAFKTSTDTWNFAGYWADVIIEYGKITGWNLEQSAKASSDGTKLLDEFCRKAMAKGVSVKTCALLIHEHGFHDAAILDDPS